MQVFSREITDYIAHEFCNYFQRKTNKTKRMSVKEAKALIDYAGTPSPSPSTRSGIDYSKPRVSGGGVKKPSEGRITLILQKIDNQTLWDEVFDELIEKVKDDTLSTRLIYLSFKERKREEDILVELGDDENELGRTTYYTRRLTILNKAAVIAVSKGLIAP